MRNARWTAPRKLAKAVTVFLFALCLSEVAAGQAEAPQAPAGEVVSLSQCVDQALAAGPDIRLSQASLGIAQADYTSSAAGNGLGLAATVSGSQQSPLVDTTPPAAGTAAPVGVASAKAGVTLTGPLGLKVDANATHSIAESADLPQTTTVSVGAGATIWDGYPGGSGRATAQLAALSLQGTQLSEDTNRKSIVYQVKQSYYTLLAQQRQIRILESTLLQRQEEMKKTQALFNAQSANQIDLKQAQVNQRGAELDLMKARNGLEISRQQLSALVGWPVDKAYTVAEVEDLPVPDITTEDAVGTALAQRADMKQLQLSQSSAQVSLALKRGQATPTVSASAGLDWTHDWSGPTDSLSASLNLNVSAPLIDGGSAAAQAKQAELQAGKLSIQQDQLAAGIATSVKSAIYSLRDLLARVDLAQSSLDLAQNQYELTRIQFDSGVKANLDVLSASVSLTTAQVSLAKARADAQLGVLALQKELGQ